MNEIITTRRRASLREACIGLFENQQEEVQERRSSDSAVFRFAAEGEKIARELGEKIARELSISSWEVLCMVGKALGCVWKDNDKACETADIRVGDLRVFFLRVV